MGMMDFYRNGWIKFPFDPMVFEWVKSSFNRAKAISENPKNHATDLRHGRTWYAGVNALPNDGAGRVGDGLAFSGQGFEWVQDNLSNAPVDNGQISIAYPGYPKQDGQETDAAFRFRLKRDAAHVDGILPIGAEKRRYVREPHAYVLGIPMNNVDRGSSPVVVWEGSHAIMRAAFDRAFKEQPIETWPDIDVTDIYASARRRCFEHCKRVEIVAQPGECYVIHRLALHGIAPWESTSQSAMRMVVYFRPHVVQGLAAWLNTA